MSASSQRKRAAKKRRQQAAMAQRGSTAAEPQEWSTNALTMLQRQELWQGPIPRPEDFRSYQDVNEGFPDRILSMAERQVTLAEQQQAHRHELEQISIRGANFRANVGLFMAFALALLVLAGAGYLILEGHEVAGTTVATLDLVGLVGVFVYGRHDQARYEQEHESGPARRKPRR